MHIETDSTKLYSTANIRLIEDHSAFRKAIERALNSPAGGHVARGFDRCEDALAALRTDAAPDVILLDVGLPGMSGIEGISHLKEQAPEACILILTVFEDDEKIFNAICAGASGYLLKNEPLSTVKSAITQAVHCQPRFGDVHQNGPLEARLRPE